MGEREAQGLSKFGGQVDGRIFGHSCRLRLWVMRCGVSH